MYLRHLLLCGPQEIGPVVVMEETVTYSLCLKNKTAQKSGGPILSPSTVYGYCENQLPCTGEGHPNPHGEVGLKNQGQ